MAAQYALPARFAEGPTRTVILLTREGFPETLIRPVDGGPGRHAAPARQGGATHVIVKRLRVPLFLAALAFPAGCRPAPPPADRPDTITVLAAASLREAFTDLAADFEKREPSVRVILGFGPSDLLATQILEGAPADVFAPAHPRWLDLVGQRRAMTDRGVMARNAMVIVLADGVRERVRGLEDLDRPGVRLVLAARSVPAGEYAEAVLARAGAAGAMANVVSRELDVKGVLQKVLLGEADAGFVYRTDVTSGPGARLDRIDIPERLNVQAEYPIAVLSDGPSADPARRFVLFVRGDGQARLRAAGFLPPI